eukprot:5204719-Pyramimonas_sp.AAC.1
MRLASTSKYRRMRYEPTVLVKNCFRVILFSLPLRMFQGACPSERWMPRRVHLQIFKVFSAQGIDDTAR